MANNPKYNYYSYGRITLNNAGINIYVAKPFIFEPYEVTIAIPGPVQAAYFISTCLGRNQPEFFFAQPHCVGKTVESIC